MRGTGKAAPFAKKSFGQNFLSDRSVIDKIVGALDLEAGETVIEIGPGRGALTEKLIESGARVAAIELEREMIRVLREKFSDAGNFRLIERDALKTDFGELVDSFETAEAHRKAKLVANLPYYISTAILQKLIADGRFFSEMVLMFQREVVERITAAPGDAERGFLSVLVETYLEAEKLFDVPPGAFRPAPKVWSAVVRLVPKTRASIGDDESYRRLLSAGFRQKRKTIYNNLKTLPAGAAGWLEALAAAGVDPSRRAETLTLEEWRKLHEAAGD